MGEGCVDMTTLFREWRELCPEPLYKSKQFPDLPGNSPTLKRIFGPPTQLSEDDYARFLALARKGKNYLLFPPQGVDKKKPSRNTNWQNWREVFPTAGKVWG